MNTNHSLSDRLQETIYILGCGAIGFPLAAYDELNLGLSKSELMEQIMITSEQSDGQMVSTLQDIKMGKPTEIDTLNLEIAHVADSMQPQVDVPETEVLGKMIVAKSLQQSSEEK